MASKKIEDLKRERQNILNNRPYLRFLGDYSLEGNRYFELEKEIKKLETSRQ